MFNLRDFDCMLSYPGKEGELTVLEQVFGELGHAHALLQTRLYWKQYQMPVDLCVLLHVHS